MKKSFPLFFSRREKFLMALLPVVVVFSFSFSYAAVSQSSINAVNDIVMKGALGLSDTVVAGEKKSAKVLYYEEVYKGFGDAIDILMASRNMIGSILGLPPSRMVEGVSGNASLGVVAAPPVISARCQDDPNAKEVLIMNTVMSPSGWNHFNMYNKGVYALRINNTLNLSGSISFSDVSSYNSMLNAKGSISPCIGDFDSAEAVTFTYGGAAEGGIPKLIIDGKGRYGTNTNSIQSRMIDPIRAQKLYLNFGKMQRIPTVASTNPIHHELIVSFGFDFNTPIKNASDAERICGPTFLYSDEKGDCNWSNPNRSSTLQGRNGTISTTNLGSIGGSSYCVFAGKDSVITEYGVHPRIVSLRYNAQELDGYELPRLNPLLPTPGMTCNSDSFKKLYPVGYRCIMGYKIGYAYQAIAEPGIARDSRQSLFGYDSNMPAAGRGEVSFQGYAPISSGDSVAIIARDGIPKIQFRSAKNAGSSTNNNGAFWSWNEGNTSQCNGKADGTLFDINNNVLPDNWSSL